VESKRKSKIPYIWLVSMGVMMARELEEPEKGLNPEPEIALGEDGMSDEVNLGESDSSYREVGKPVVKNYRELTSL
jgi:hypothetical protein